MPSGKAGQRPGTLLLLENHRRIGTDPGCVGSDGWLSNATVAVSGEPAEMASRTEI